MKESNQKPVTRDQILDILTSDLCLLTSAVYFSV